MVLLISSTTHINKDVLWVILILIRAVFWCISVRITVSILPRHFLIFSVKLQRAPKQLLNIYTVIIGKTGHDLKWLSVKSQNLMLSPQQLNICTEIIGKTGYDFKSPSVKSQNLIQRNISAGYLLCRRLLFFTTLSYRVWFQWHQGVSGDSSESIPGLQLQIGMYILLSVNICLLTIFSNYFPEMEWSLE